MKHFIFCSDSQDLFNRMKTLIADETIRLVHTTKLKKLENITTTITPTVIIIDGGSFKEQTEAITFSRCNATYLAIVDLFAVPKKAHYNQIGYDFVLRKPFDKKELMAFVQAIDSPKTVEASPAKEGSQREKQSHTRPSEELKDKEVSPASVSFEHQNLNNTQVETVSPHRHKAPLIDPINKQEQTLAKELNTLGSLQRESDSPLLVTEKEKSPKVPTPPLPLSTPSTTTSIEALKASPTQAIPLVKDQSKQVKDVSLPSHLEPLTPLDKVSREDQLLTLQGKLSEMHAKLGAVGLQCLEEVVVKELSYEEKVRQLISQRNKRSDTLQTKELIETALTSKTKEMPPCQPWSLTLSENRRYLPKWKRDYTLTQFRARKLKQKGLDAVGIAKALNAIYETEQAHFQQLLAIQTQEKERRLSELKAAYKEKYLKEVVSKPELKPLQSLFNEVSELGKEAEASCLMSQPDLRDEALGKSLESNPLLPAPNDEQLLGANTSLKEEERPLSKKQPRLQASLASDCQEERISGNALVSQPKEDPSPSKEHAFHHLETVEKPVPPVRHVMQEVPTPNRSMYQTKKKNEFIQDEYNEMESILGTTKSEFSSKGSLADRYKEAARKKEMEESISREKKLKRVEEIPIDPPRQLFKAKEAELMDEKKKKKGLFSRK